MHQDQLPGTFFGPSTLVQLLRHRARFQPDDVAYTILVDGEYEQFDLTYLELDRQARAIAAWLETRDLVGERALLLYPAGAEFISAFFGCLYAGVVAVPAYPPRRNRSLERIQAIVDDAEAKVALTTDVVLNRVEKLIDETPHLKELTWLATCHVAEDMADKWQEPDIRGDTLAFLQYTSGSTGTPKGVMLSHTNLAHNSALISFAYEHTRSGSGVFWLPSYHDMGLIGGILQPMYLGRPNVLMSPMSFLQKPFRWLSAISRFRCTTSGGPNFAYDLCVRKVTPEQRETLDLSSWNVAFNGAEPVRAATLDAFTEAFEPCGFRREAFYPCFGLAEATLIVSGGRVSQPPIVRTFEAAALAQGKVVDAEPEADGIREMVGCGETLPDQKIVIADPEKMTCAPSGQVGEIWAAGPSIAQGYWRNEEATRETFHAYLKDTGEGPFMRTGDLGFMQDGELFVTGRIKDMMIIRGVNHYPQDVELTVQQSHPRLRRDSGAVFTVEIDGREQLIVVQEVERRKKGDFDEILDAIRSDVASEHDLAIDAILLVKAGSVPKTSSNKIQRYACRENYLEGSLPVVASWQVAAVGKPAASEPGGAATQPAPDDDGTAPDRERITQIVIAEIRRIARERADGLTLDSPIVGTGMDSLERMEILAALEERFGGRLPEEIFPDLETTRQVVDAVQEHLSPAALAGAAPLPDREIPEKDYTFGLFPEYHKLRQSLDLLETSGIGNPFFMPHEGICSDVTMIGGREYINFCSYNYSGMAGDPVVMQAAKDAIDKYGAGVSASRLVAGEKDLHGQLERAIARFIGAEDCVVMVAGHATNETVIGHLLGPGDLILHDALSHNSIIQGSILSGARRRPFPHNDWEAAGKLLAEHRHEYRRVMIVVEGVYSMDGDYPDLPRFIEIKKEHKALLMIDEAHSLGVMGPRGRGITEYFGVDPKDVDVLMGTLSKSPGNSGGYIAGCKELVEYLKYTTPGFVFSLGLTPASTAGALAAIRLWEAEPERFVRLHENAKLFLGLAKQHGLNTGMSQNSPIVPIILGNSLDCMRLSQALFARGVSAMPIVHPAVEEGVARLRFFITSLHNEKQLRYTIDVMAEELRKINPDYLGGSK